MRAPLDQPEVGHSATDPGDGLPADGFTSTEDFLSDGNNSIVIGS